MNAQKERLLLDTAPDTISQTQVELPGAEDQERRGCLVRRSDECGKSIKGVGFLGKSGCRFVDGRC